MLTARHTLVEIDAERRNAVADRLAAGLLPMHRRPEIEARVRHFFLDHPVPGIVCAPKGPLPEGHVQLGVSFPFRQDDVRVRSAVSMPVDVVGRAHSPWDVATRIVPGAFAGTDELSALVRLGREHGVSVGLFGSAALQVLTGLPYLESRSDIDMVVTTRDVAGLRSFRAALADFGRRYGRTSDVEVALPSGLGVKLAELVSDVAMVIGRGIDGVRLVDRRRILEEIDASVALLPTP